ncbi:cyclopropane-fatty-acyl-phospholipid synthase [Mycena epipterygia]|nr:cyclopropane-fatty-acyl-phospholipid synthase [Mycena epipterygia]
MATKEVFLHQPTLRDHFFAWANVGSTIYSRGIQYARAQAFQMLTACVLKGGLIINDAKGTHHLGDMDPKFKVVTIKVHNDRIWARIAMSYDIGLAEGYMAGDFEVSSLSDLLNMWLDNRTQLQGLSSYFSMLFAKLSGIYINAFGQNLKMAKWNAQVAYDVLNEFMQCMLSEECMYSCAIWGPEENGPRGDLTVGSFPGDLEAAQQRKIGLMLKYARLKEGDRLLEIGTGWGAMAIGAARLGCHVETITLSIEQKKFAEKRLMAAGLSDRVNVHLLDYRNLPASFGHSFDALIASEMIEHVGPKNYKAFLNMMDWTLKENKAAAVMTASGQPEHRYTNYHASYLVSTLQAIIPGKFVLYRVEDHGIHYPRTLREWGRRFDKNLNDEVLKDLKEKYPVLQDENNMKAFIRKWQYLFVYAEVGFARGYVTVPCWTFTRPENPSELCA